MPTPSAFVLLAHYLLVLGMVWSGRWVFERSMPLGARGPARRAAFLGIALAWLGGTLALARAGVLYHPDAVPPRIVFLIGPATLAVIGLCWSPFGTRVLRSVPVPWIVAFQLFRLPVELILWQLHREGFLPERMTFEGSNHEWVTVLSVPIVLLACRRRVVTWVVLAWNVLGLATLVEIMSIALRSMPGPWRAFTDGPANTIVLTSSFVWIPVVYVLAALAAHVLLFRALLTSGWRVTSGSRLGSG